jgi:acetate kinase
MDAILTINSGSSTLRFALFQTAPSLSRVLAGKFERIGLPESRYSATDFAMNQKQEATVEMPSHTACIPLLGKLLAPKLGTGAPAAIGHRVVHGGARYRDPQQVDGAMLEELRRISPYDPEHLIPQISLIEALQKQYPSTRQIACFDTAFHSSLPRVAQILPIPRRYQAQGVQRYGFHGLSYSYLMGELERVAGRAAARGRVILAHLGNGASMAAVRDGQSIDTTMGFTPASGLVMSTRSGDIDPGLVAYLAHTEGMTPEQFYTMANSQSGLLGVSETSSDVRDLLQRETAGDVRAKEALDLFCYQARKTIGALAAALGGLDTLVFAGGIGENGAVIRERICDGLGFLGIELDPTRNSANSETITKDGSAAIVRTIRTDEELYIAQAVTRMLG